MSYRDLFAGGGGGWSMAARSLGIRLVGLELDQDSCATRAAAGLATQRGDVAMLTPPRRLVGARCKDDRSLLVVEPLRWALASRPRWVALEQVEDVLPVWEHIGRVLAARGYSVWTGLLNAANYGVPQTRVRAILVASRTRAVGPPAPSHSDQRRGGCLLGLAPWVSMAAALGWDEEDAVGFPRRDDTGSGGEYRKRDRRAASEPSFTLGEKARSFTRVTTGENSRQAGGTTKPYERDTAQPAPTLTQKTGTAWELHTNRDQREDGSRQTVDSSAPAPAPALTAKSGGQWMWERPAPTLVTSRRSDEGLIVGRQLADGEGRNVGGWGYERPATTVAGDPRLGSPGHRDREGGERQFQEAVRVTLAEASILQGFPPDHPWQGNKTSCFRQVGNAIPPALALAVLQVAVGASAEAAA